jgi:putative ABC transport system substrate-binding protein
MLGIRRREFIPLLGGAVTWPLAARAQQAKLVIGFLNNLSPDGYSDRLRAFRQGLKEAGYTEGENVTIEYRWADGNNERLPALAADLVQRRVDVVAALGSPALALAPKAAITTIPIVFLVGEDPVRLGIVKSLARPEGNLTGVNLFNEEIAAKRLNLLRELVPGAARGVALVNPENPANVSTTATELENAAHALGIQLRILRAANSKEINQAFTTFAKEPPDALFISGDTLFNTRRVQLVQLATHHRIPTTYGSRSYPEIGGLMSYGADVPDGYRQAGVYTGRILKGAKPAELPVVQSSRFELVINHETARMLDLIVSPSLIATADEVIE